jgi:hypothetical protein
MAQKGKRDKGSKKDKDHMKKKKEKKVPKPEGTA